MPATPDPSPADRRAGRQDERAARTEAVHASPRPARLPSPALRRHVAERRQEAFRSAVVVIETALQQGRDPRDLCREHPRLPGAAWAEVAARALEAVR